MQSRFGAIIGVLLVALCLAAPGYAQDLSVESDPFAGVSAVDGEQMSAVSGQPGGVALPQGDSQGTGTACTGNCDNSVQVTIGAPVTEKIQQGNTFTVNVTASNHQTSIVSGVINTGGGLNVQNGGSSR